jgi:acyl dehydratase
MSRGGGVPAHTLLLGRWLAASLREGRAGWAERRARVELGPFRPDPGHVARYLRATHGEGLTFLGQGLLPPSYAALWETAAALEILRRVGAPPPHRGLVHLESERLVIRPLRLDGAPRLVSELGAVEPHPRGSRVVLRSRVIGAGERPCAESTFVLLLRGEGARAAQRSEEGEAEGAWTPVASWRLPASQGRRYARASGDFNPVHLWGWSARPFGYASPIVHGFCLEAMVAHALLRERLGGEVRALTRLAIRFRAPVALPALLKLEVPESGAGRFRVTGGREGKVLATGEWGGAPRTPGGVLSA